MLATLLKPHCGMGFHGWRPEACNFIIKETVWHRRFPVNFAKFLRTALFIEHFRWLLLKALRDIKEIRWIAWNNWKKKQKISLNTFLKPHTLSRKHRNPSGLCNIQFVKNFLSGHKLEMKPTAYFKNLKKSSETIVSWLNWRKMITFWYCSRIPGRFCNQRISFRSSSLWKIFLQWLGRKLWMLSKTEQPNFLHPSNWLWLLRWDIHIGHFLSRVHKESKFPVIIKHLTSNITLAWFMQFRWQLKTTYSCFYLVNIL